MRAAAQSVAQPTPRVGDHWRFASENRLTGRTSEETRTVRAVQAERILCDNDSTDPAFARGVFVYTRAWNLLARPALAAAGDSAQDAGQWRWQPYYPHFRFPLRPGLRWQGEARVTNSATGTTNVHRYTAAVGDEQSITVPAGSFDVQPVRYDAEVVSDDGAARLTWHNLETLYYAPAVLLFAQAEHRITGPDGRPARDSRLQLLQVRRG